MMIGITHQGDTPANTTRSSSGRAFQQLFERLHDRMAEIFCPGEMAHSSSEHRLDPLRVLPAKPSYGRASNGDLL
jgi:hypothetical protein